MSKEKQMPKEYTEKEIQEIKTEYKKSYVAKERTRLLCIKLRVIKNMSTRQISAITELSVTYINEIIRNYHLYGIEGLKSKKQTSHNRNMTFEEETKFLEPFRKKAEAGEILEVSEIITAYSEALDNKKVSKSTVYKMLHRHDWRKVMPRSQHPKKADSETIEAYKKTNFESS